MFKRLRILLTVFWHLLKVFGQMLYGTWRISKLNFPIVTVFGGSRLKLNDPYAVQASVLTKKLLEKDISILSGGGPGIMQAVSCSILEHQKAKNIGIGVRGLSEGHNNCVGEYFELDYFFARKWLLTRFSRAYIVFPGGFGTFDEMFEMLTLIQTKRMKSKPIILIGTEFWKPLLDWFTNKVLKHGAIDTHELELFVLTDDVDTVFELIKKTCEK